MVLPAPDVTILPDPASVQLFAVGDLAPPESPVSVKVEVIVIVFPEAEVAMPEPPAITRLFTNGIAVPESVVNEVAICGFDFSISIRPA